MSPCYRIAVLGGGSFGTTLCNILAENGHRATLWLRDPQRAEEINRDHKNSYYLPQLRLHDNVVANTDLLAAVEGADLVFFSVPSSSCRSVAEQLAPCIGSKAEIISTTKGIEREQFRLMSEVLAEQFPGHPLGVLSGPNLAKEIAAKEMTATVIASESAALIEKVQAALGSQYFRVYASEDVFGVELGGALKNIYAIMSGIADALQLGANTRAMLLTRSLAEMSRFAVTLGANPLTFLGLSGVGDLIVTCSSPLSRNFQVGQALGSGKSLQQATEQLGQVAEGVNTLQLVQKKADELGVYMPLVQGLYQILYQQVPLQDAVSQLMENAQTTDVAFTL